MDPEQQTLLAPTPENLASVKVFPLIPALKRDVTNTIDSALSWEQLTAADINFSIVRPIVNKYARLRNMAVVYACLVVRSYFLAETETDLAFAGVMLSRANLCEILAMKLLSRFANNYIQLVAVLTTSWNPLAGATPQVIQEVKSILNAHEDDIDSAPKCHRDGNLHELQIVPRVAFAAQRSILADNYKPRSIEIYNPQNSPFLDHYRLRVPKYGIYLEFLNFALLLLTFVLCLSNRDKAKMTPWEVAFIVFAGAFALEEYTASTEHGWGIYIANMWNAFDSSFILIFVLYLVMRVRGLSNDDLPSSDMAFDILACGACILIPRLAFFAISNNIVVLSLRAMISQFVFFIGIAAICFSGLMFTLWTLASDSPDGDPWTLKAIAWLMTQIWFGNTYLSFAQAKSFHPVFGPILMTVFAALSNTLLLTILISILSNTFAQIDANATQEYLFQFTISTIEGVKSDALFSYQPPFNVLAFVLLKPASWFLTPRALHSFNVFLIRVTSLPQLIIIGMYERYLASGQSFRETGVDAAQSLFNSLPRHIKNMPLVEALVGSSSNDLFDAIFDVEVNDGDFDIFDSDAEADVPALRSLHSRENMRMQGSSKDRGESRSPVPKIRRRRPTSLGRVSTRGAASIGESSVQPSPKQFGSGLTTLSPVDMLTSPEITISAGSNLSPLARLFNSRFSSVAPAESNSSMAAQAAAQAAASTEASVKHIEALLEAVSELPVHRLKEEMKELQDRQARIENLLLMLTRGMRNEIHRQGTVG
ncbi:unnamed protein product [Cyclocybe aegerita]|uniref:Receptor-activated Ca2+-permeable cation channel n=1 Tax=Cyclocybe aegerita TaxID=1973307 RepID=A0A8S0VWU4_CYCAE|nr:unnamed protein product [Cyclocybe aegerita]